MSLPLILVLHNVRSLHNVGAIFRSADGADVKQIILSGLTPTPPRHEISKTALGATESISWQYLRDLAPKLKELKKAGYSIAALEQTSSAKNFYTQKVKLPLVLIVGHEREGIEKEILELCDLQLELPMLGKNAHSLNVSNATSIALYELVRRFWYDKKS